MSLKKLFAICLIAVAGCISLSAESITRYRINDVQYDSVGRTRPYALSIAVKIDKTKVFESEDALTAYVSDIRLQLENQRVLESVSVDPVYGSVDPDGITSVSLLVKSVDTWNMIVVPYPKYDSNSGFQFKLKLKDYNAFGSMQPLTIDLIYANDEKGKTHLGGSIDTSIPFEAFNHDAVWNIASSLDIPLQEDPEFHISSGLDVAFPLTGILTVHAGFVQSFALNDRDDNGNLYVDDTHYFTEKLYANMPVLIGTLGHLGKAYWTPSITYTANIDENGMQNKDLKGPDLAFAHAISFGRVDWTNNFRDGLTVSANNSWTYNLGRNVFTPQIDATIQGYKSFFDRVGIASRAYAFYRFDGENTTSIAEKVRGIRDTRIQSDGAIVFNLDMPVRIFRVNFAAFEPLRKLDFFSCEVQLSPFFDMALTHDRTTGAVFSFSDGWYASGLEMLVYPKKMRSIYVRASFGVDVPEFVDGNFKIGASAKRDNASIYEFTAGIGLQY